jgi:Amt family ammonium transporter
VFAAPAWVASASTTTSPTRCSDDYSIAGQLWIQFEGVVTTVVWSGVVAFIAYKLVDLLIGLRVPEEEEREGLDITSHGETAYEA